MKIHRSILPVLVLLLISSACSGSDAADTSTEAAAETTITDPGTVAPAAAATTTAAAAAAAATTTAATSTTAVEPAATETTATENIAAADVPVNIAAAAFNFLAGTSPRVLMIASISAAGPDGPWQAAGDPPGPTLVTGSEFFVRYEVANTSSNATMTGLDMSVPGVGPVCTDFDGLEPLGTFDCVVGPFVAEAGSREIEIDIDADGSRQGESDSSIIDPPLRIEHSFDGVAHAFTMLFAVDLAALDGVLVDGSASEAAVEIRGLGLAGPVTIDCSDEFPEGFSETGGSPQAGEPRVFAYAITNYNTDGSVAGTCAQIPVFRATFRLDDDSDVSINYEGA